MRATSTELRRRRPYCRIRAWDCGAGVESWWPGRRRKFREAGSSRRTWRVKGRVAGMVAILWVGGMGGTCLVVVMVVVTVVVVR